MRRVPLFLYLFFGTILLNAQTITPFESDENQNTTAEYHEVIAFYETLAKAHADHFQFSPVGMTDSGEPL